MTLDLVLLGVKINLYSCVAFNMKSKITKMVKLTPENIKDMLFRPKINVKSAIIEFQKLDKDDFAFEPCEFGKTWARKYKFDLYALPSLNELIEGLFMWYVGQQDKNLSSQTKLN